MTSRALRGLLLLALAVTAILVGRESYLVFHALAETFCAVVAMAAFAVSFNARHLLIGDRLVVRLGVVLLGAGAIDLLHMLAYSGMGVFAGLPAAVGGTADLATQLWLAGRFVLATGLVAALVLDDSEPRVRQLLAGTCAVTIGLVALVFGGGFPAAFQPTGGLTPFKIAAEGVICLTLVAAGILLWRRRRALEPRLVGLVSGAVALSIASELAFMLYAQPYGVANMVGHLLKVAAYLLLYKALVELGLREPLATLFAELRESEAALESANRGLEARVAERTFELEQRQEQLQSLARELTQVERRARRRLAGQLHDELAQLLAAMRMRLGALRPDEPQRLEESRAALTDLVEEAIRFTRDLISQLAPPRLEQGGLAAALRVHAEWMARHHGFAVEIVEGADLPVLDADARETVFNALRELLTNAARHSGAAGARLELARNLGASLVAVVEDDGGGFDPSVLPDAPGASGGFGLANLREQVALAGGTFILSSRPGAGTRAEIRVPAVTAPGLGG